MSGPQAEACKVCKEPHGAKPVKLPCLHCGKEHGFEYCDLHATGVFNVFCDGVCEDKYAATQ